MSDDLGTLTGADTPPAHDTDLTVARRYRGPAGSGNGGWTAGTLAARVEGAVPGEPVTVSLHQPPPLEVPMQVTSEDGVVSLTHGDGLVARARRAAEAELRPLEWVAPATAHDAEQRFAGLGHHPFPTCFVCGTAREDGLRIFPGRLDDGRVAATWRPDASLAESSDLEDGEPRLGLGTTWAAIDCTGGWAADLEGRPMVLGTMTAQVEALPVVGDDHVVVGELRGSEGRRTFTAATLYDPDRRVVARAEHVWVAISPEAIAALNG